MCCADRHVDGSHPSAATAQSAIAGGSRFQFQVRPRPPADHEEGGLLVADTSAEGAGAVGRDRDTGGVEDYQPNAVEQDGNNLEWVCSRVWNVSQAGKIGAHLGGGQQAEAAVADYCGVFA